MKILRTPSNIMNDCLFNFIFEEKTYKFVSQITKAKFPVE